jgi:hypothetical protein
VVALTFLVSTLGVPTGVEASGVVVRMTAPDGSLIARRNERRVELQLPGQPALVFENASVSVTRSRITISARTRERTLVAWCNRANNSGAIGVLVRTGNPRKPEKFGLFPRSIEVEGETARTRIVRR